MLVKITRRFVDNGGQLFGPGEWDLRPNIADRLIHEGRATRVVDLKPQAKTTPEIPETSLQQMTEPDIPVDFPSRATLIVNGITTLEQLKSEGIKEQIEKIPGISTLTITKIGLAITSLD